MLVFCFNVRKSSWALQTKNAIVSIENLNLTLFSLDTTLLNFTQSAVILAVFRFCCIGINLDLLKPASQFISVLSAFFLQNLIDQSYFLFSSICQRLVWVFCSIWLCEASFIWETNAMWYTEQTFNDSIKTSSFRWLFKPFYEKTLYREISQLEMSLQNKAQPYLASKSPSIILSGEKSVERVAIEEEPQLLGVIGRPWGKSNLSFLFVDTASLSLTPPIVSTRRRNYEMDWLFYFVRSHQEA